MKSAADVLKQVMQVRKHKAYFSQVETTPHSVKRRSEISVINNFLFFISSCFHSLSITL